MEKTGNKKRRIWLTVLLSVVIFLFIVFISAFAVFKYYYGMLNIEKDEDNYEEQTTWFLDDEETQFITEGSDTAEISQGTEVVMSSEGLDSTPNPESPEISESLENTTAELEISTQIIESTVAQATTAVQTTQESLPSFEDMEGAEDVFRVLLIGVDSKENNINGRSDVMILFDINPKTKKIVMTSLLRDIYVDIPGYKSNRLNAAYALGGAKLLVQTISQNFGIEVDKYVIINYWLVRDVVDALGGVDVNITKEELDQINHNLNEQNRLLNNPYGTDHLPATSIGKVHLNGNQALAYARIRKADSDFGRTNRQRNVVSAGIEKVKGLGFLEINNMLNQFLPRVTTNLTEKDVLSLMVMAVKRKNYSIESMAIPVSGTWEYATIDGKAVIKLDFAANAKAWYKKVVGE